MRKEKISYQAGYITVILIALGFLFYQLIRFNTVNYTALTIVLAGTVVNSITSLLNTKNKK